MRWEEIRWDEIRWDEVWSVKGEVWSFKCDFWSTKSSLGVALQRARVRAMFLDNNSAAGSHKATSALPRAGTTGIIWYNVFIVAANFQIGRAQRGGTSGFASVFHYVLSEIWFNPKLLKPDRTSTGTVWICANSDNVGKLQEVSILAGGLFATLEFHASAKTECDMILAATCSFGMKGWHTASKSTWNLSEPRVSLLNQIMSKHFGKL